VLLLAHTGRPKTAEAARTVALRLQDAGVRVRLLADEAKQPALHLKTLYRTPITFSRDPRSVLAYLAQGEVVEVVGLGEAQHCVVARIATGATRGWVDVQALEAPPVGLMDKLRARREKAEAHRELIEQHEVAVTMTRAAVILTPVPP